MNAGLKILVAAILGIAAMALLVSLYVASRQRALVSHCRNNLRHLGGLASRNWENLTKQKTGRAFWQEIREAQYLSTLGKWEVPLTQPFTCPVLGREPGNPEDPASIDYLGPATVRKDLRQTPKMEPIGADRPGNHSSGGLILRLDTSVQEIPAIVTPAGASDPAWQEALRVLKD
jgi:hypothetical protein